MNRADYNVGTLESEIKVQFEQAVSALNQTTTALGGIVSLLKDTNSQLNNLKNNNGLKDLQKQSVNFKDAFKSTIKIGVIAGGLKKGFNTVKDITSASIDMIETTNLFEVQMGKIVDEYGNLDEAQSQYYTKAMTFQDKMNEKLATNKSEMQKYQAMYYGMLNSQLGSKNRDTSYLMSENLTKAGYDIASLYNLDVETAMNKLKSGLAGQIESLRQIGIDVSEASLAKVLDEVGIDRSVQKLSYAEKEVARYIAIVEQAGKAQGDFARTFEQPANQLRVFQNQLLELKQVAGSFFIGLFGQIMPVINGIIMAIKEILKVLGVIFGFKIDSSISNTADTIGDIDDGIGSATKKAKEFKKQLMGFDEINNITPPSDANKNSGSSAIGVDSKLLDALKEWDNKMDSISGKAQEIRDKILDWLGFTKDENRQLQWSWKNMNGIAKVLSTVAGIIGGIYVIGKLTKLVNWLKTLFTIFKTGNGATTTFGLGLQTIGKIIKGLFGETGVIALVSGGLGTLHDAMIACFGGVATTITGIVGVVGGAWIAIKNFIDMLKEGFSWVKEFFMVVGIAIATVGAIILGVPAGIAAAVASIVAVIATVIVVVKNNWEQIKLFFTDTIPQAWSNFWNWLGEKWSDFTTWLGSLPEKIGYEFGFVLGTIVKFFTQTIPKAWTDFWNWVGQKWNDFTNWLTGLPAKIWEGLKNIGTKVVNFFTITLPEAWNNFINWIKELPAKFLQFGLDIIQGLINGIKQKWINFWTAVKDFINGFVQGFKDALGIHSPSTIFQGFGVNIIEGLINGISNMIGNLRNKIFEIGNNINNWFSEKISNIKQIGYNIVLGITNGISSAISGLRNKVQGLANNVYSWFKNALGIHSPSKVMADLAQYIPMGIAKGIDDNADIVYDSVRELNQGIKINTKDFAVDTNQYVNYSAIKGQIQAQSNVTMKDSIAEEIKEAVIEGMRNSRITVEVEGKADKDGIFKVVQTGAREYTMQTGEPAFSY